MKNVPVAPSDRIERDGCRRISTKLAPAAMTGAPSMNVTSPEFHAELADRAVGLGEVACQGTGEFPGPTDRRRPGRRSRSAPRSPPLAATCRIAPSGSRTQTPELRHVKAVQPPATW